MAKIILRSYSSIYIAFFGAIVSYEYLEQHDPKVKFRRIPSAALLGGVFDAVT